MVATSTVTWGGHTHPASAASPFRVPCLPAVIRQVTWPAASKYLRSVSYRADIVPWVGSSSPLCSRH